MKKLIYILIATIALVASFPVIALEGETIVFNPVTGNYLITYLDSNDNSLRQVIFIPATKINPTIISKLKLGNDGAISYKYTLSSGRDSRQNIVHIALNPVSSVITSLPDIPLIPSVPFNTQAEQDANLVTIERAVVLMRNVAKSFYTPSPWRATMSYSNELNKFRIGWRTKVTNGMQPGIHATFGFNSHDLPSIIQAEVKGFAPGSKEIPGEETQDAEDGGFGQQYENLINSNYIRRPAAVPSITVPIPFNAAVLIERIQTQMHTWIAMQLLDATFSSQLDRYLTAAADAYRHNQPKAGKEHIQTLRKMLKKEHEDCDKEDEKEDGGPEVKHDDKAKRVLIDRLAARVLDFDLKYVLKRMGGEG